MTTKRIGRYVGRSRTTILRWFEKEGFPMCHLPNGDWATSATLIDAWLMARGNVERLRKAGRGTPAHPPGTAQDASGAVGAKGVGQEPGV